MISASRKLRTLREELTFNIHRIVCALISVIPVENVWFSFKTNFLFSIIFSLLICIRFEMSMMMLETNQRDSLHFFDLQVPKKTSMPNTCCSKLNLVA